MQMFWYKRKKKILIYILCFIFSISWLLLLNNVFWIDLMEQAFTPAINRESIINIWKSKTQVWQNVLRERTTINVNLLGQCVNESWIQIEVDPSWPWTDDQEKCEWAGWIRDKNPIDVYSKAPLIVRITKFLLRITIVLSISMVIFNSIKYMIEVIWWKDRKSAESKKNLIYVIIWVILALLSVSIINLIISVPKSSLRTSDDISGFIPDKNKKNLTYNKLFKPHHIPEKRK